MTARCAERPNRALFLAQSLPQVTQRQKHNGELTLICQLTCFFQKKSRVLLMKLNMTNRPNRGNVTQPVKENTVKIKVRIKWKLNWSNLFW